jgi:hypothetical protein
MPQLSAGPLGRRPIIMQQSFKYEIAISYLSEDEQTALILNKELGQRVSTFISPERQSDIVGRDGETIFNQVFGKETRIVVVLYREQWGSRTWTRIEKTAIQNRAMDEGYDFTVFVLMENGITPPKWLPKNRVWHDFPRFGIQSLVYALQTKIEESGGKLHTETVEQQIARISTEVEQATKKKHILQSNEIVAVADAEAETLKATLENKAQSLSKSQTLFVVSTKRDFESVILSCKRVQLTVGWHIIASNTLNQSNLYSYLSEKDKSAKRPFEVRYIDREHLDFQFDLNDLSQNGWRQQGSNSHFFHTEELADFLLKKFIDLVGNTSLG